MSIAVFHRDSFAKFYATQHLKTDEAVKSVIYLPKDCPPREIRLIEVNKLISERRPRQLVPIDFGVDMGQESEHSLYVVDVTPDEWLAIEHGEIALPQGWTLEEKRVFT